MVSKAVVLEKLINSFQPVVYPGDLNIVYDNTGEHLECVEVQQAFQGKHWREVSYETLHQENTSLSFMTPDAFKFYLPAYLLFVVQDFERSDILPDTTVQYLMLPTEADDLAKANFFLGHPNPIQSELTQFLLEEVGRSNQKVHQFIERVSKLSDQQSQAIRYYLEYLKVYHRDYFLDNEPQVAIDRYWFIFEVSDNN